MEMCKFENEELPLKMFSCNGAKWQRGVFAPLRERFKVFAGYDTELNRIVTVQECDARMMMREQMPETKKQTRIARIIAN